MVDREKVLVVLSRRFPGAQPEQLAAAANAIVGLGEEWEDVTDRDDEVSGHESPRCSEVCYLARQADRGDEFRVFRRRKPGTRR
jgi:hypothetical protein